VDFIIRFEPGIYMAMNIKPEVQ